MYLNVDLGEEIKPNLEIEDEVMPYIDACNIACGGHAGNPRIIKDCIYLAKKHDVLIGAHPSYPDKANFGRKSMIIPDEQLIESLFYQIYLVHKLAEDQNTEVHHIKFHGALYNDAARDTDLALLLVNIIKEYDRKCILLAPPNSALSAVAKSNNIKVHYEIFGDRNYNDDGSLVNRKLKNALIKNKLDLSIHIQSILKEKNIKSINHKIISMGMNTMCMHSDHEGAIDNIKLVSKCIKQINTK